MFARSRTVGAQIRTNGDRIRIHLKTSGCRGTPNEVRSLEHVVARITLSASFRGDVTIHLTSPQRTTSRLLRHRARDDSNDGFTNWPFMTVFHWGEDPTGEWTLEIIAKKRGNKITLKRWNLSLYGTKESPDNATTCHSECLSGCFGSGPDDCYGCLHFKIATKGDNYTCVATCPPHLYSLFTTNGRNATCSSTCPRGRYRARSSTQNGPFVCKKCPTGCTRCKSKRYCHKCKDGWNMLDYKQARHTHYRQCVLHCWTSYYLHKEKKTCFPCSTNCSTCDGPANTDCLSCFHPEVLHQRHCHDACPSNLHPLTLEHNNGVICVADCEAFEGYYLDRLSSRCGQCNALCSSCRNESHDACTSCKSRYYMLDSTCLFSCPQGYEMTKSSKGRVCKYCGHDGSLCFRDSVASQQLDDSECPSGTFREVNMPRSLACVRRCRDGYYADSRTRRCAKCPRRCAQCRNPTVCTSCKTPYSLYETKCVSECPLGHFTQQTNAQTNVRLRCLQCDAACRRCNGSDVCTQCAQQCPPCRRRCEECRSAAHAQTKCVRCSRRYYLHGSRCSIDCPDGYYRNANRWTCDRCHSSCLSCFGPGPARCTRCDGEWALYSDRCLPSCPLGLFRRFVSEGRRVVCVATCAPGMYGDGVTGDCTACHPLCSACFASGSSNCTACRSDARLDGTVCSFDESRSISGRINHEVTLQQHNHHHRQQQHKQQQKKKQQQKEQQQKEQQQKEQQQKEQQQKEQQQREQQQHDQKQINPVTRMLINETRIRPHDDVYDPAIVGLFSTTILLLLLIIFLLVFLFIQTRRKVSRCTETVHCLSSAQEEKRTN